VETAAFDYELPEERIAQEPLPERDAARLLVDRGPDLAVDHEHVCDLPRLVHPGDLVVVNTTRVLPARLHLRKATGGAVEVLLLERRADGRWEALVRPGRRVAAGMVLRPAAMAPGDLAVEVGEAVGHEGVRLVRLLVDGDPVVEGDALVGGAELAALERAGEVPLPPYITTPLIDPERYQTVFAERPGSAAAPTAGLHLTPELLDACRARGASVAPVELVVGLGTFRPIAVERVEDHVMHHELYRVPPETMVACRAARSVVAVGTSVLRALESAAATGQLEGRTDLYVHGDFPFQVVDRLLTNFHLPRSSLLVLVEAFVGPRWRDLYDEALASDYRFLSFGDAMLLNRAAAR